MFRQFFIVFLLFAAFFGSSMARFSDESFVEDSNERIVVKAEPRLALRTRRPIRTRPIPQRW